MTIKRHTLRVSSSFRKLAKRHPCAYKDKRGNVKEQVDDGTKNRLLRLSVEEAIPRECGAAGKCRQEVI